MQPKSSLKNRIQSFKYALNGLYHVVKNEANFQLQLLIGVLTIILAWYLDISRSEWLWIIISIGAVLTCEVFNTAIEILVDLKEPNQNKQAGLIKDISAGAVLIVSITAVIIGLIIFLPKFL